MTELCQQVSTRLKREGLAGGTLQIDMRWPNLTWSQHQISLEFSTNSAYSLLEKQKTLLIFIEREDHYVQLE